MSLNYSSDFRRSVAEIADYEQAGIDRVLVPEAYSFDAISQLGYLAARTERVELASGILQLYTRTPTLTAMTAAGLDYVSDGRFILGLGASGPQVIEGFHGVRYDAPLGRTREIVEICRSVWKREKLVHDGANYQIPVPAGEGTGLGKPLAIINHPVRDRIPISLAAIGPKNVELAAEIAEGWQPVLFDPERAATVWGESLTAGLARRDPDLGPLDITVNVPFAISDDDGPLLDAVRPQLALYIGGMGARTKNFYNDLTRRYGYASEAAEVQELYLSGQRAAAAAALPIELVRSVSLIGPLGFVREHLAALAQAGVGTIGVDPLARTHAERLRSVEQLRELT
jgi:F420-dependent oxidoreductase-like protein